MLREIAIGTPANRHKLVNESDIPGILAANGYDQPVYLSVYSYDESSFDEMKNKKASEWGLIQRYIDWVPIDIDKGNNSDEQTIKLAAEALHILTSELGLNRDNLKLYFSGNGYHIIIHGDCFGFNDLVRKKSNDGVYDLPFCVKQTMTSLPGIGDTLDSSIYQHNGLLRAVYTLNTKSNRYKIPLTFDEVMSCDYSHVHELSLGRRFDFEWGQYYGDRELSSYVKETLPDIRTYDDKVKDPSKYRSCISSILLKGPVTGRRNHDLLVLASALMQIGMPLDYAKRVAIDWNKNSLDLSVVNKQVEYTYNRDYMYGCAHKFLRPHCDTKCKHYVNRDISTSIVDNEQVLLDAYALDLKGMSDSGMNLGRILGYTEANNAYSELILTPNDSVVTLIGPTKAGKSTFMKHIVLGIDMSNPNNLMPQYRKKTLYYTGEQSPAHWINHCAQILGNVTKEEFMHQQKALLDRYGRYITEKVIPHYPVEPSSGWEQHIKDGGYELIVVDTIDHALIDNRNEHQEKLAMLKEAQRLNSIYGTIFWFVSQINRESTKMGKTTLVSGKGSGAIENQSRKLIGLENTNNPSVKKLIILADTYGAPGIEIEYQLYRTGRLETIGK